MTIWTHEVTVTFENGKQKVFDTYSPGAWDTLEKVQQSPYRASNPVSVSVRERTATEVKKDLEAVKHVY